MTIELLKYPTADDWMLCRQATLVTVGKEATEPPSMRFKQKILEARHSPIRTLMFMFRLTDIPSWVSVHLCRHVHAQPFVKSQRNDRQSEYDRNKAPQDTPVSMMWWMNAEELMTIANKRLCYKASPETREVVRLMCEEVVKVCPEFDGLLVPACEYNGKCHEMYSCGRWDQ